ncbi:MAG: SPOR domain-containing protein, partial [Pseudomonadota bacterium]
PEEMKANLNKRSGRDWIINIKSATAPEEIVPAAIALTKEGYPAYMTRVNLKGKDWVRLRLGFFGNRAEADAVGKEIQKRLNLADTWSSKAGKNEIAEFGGF